MLALLLVFHQTHNLARNKFARALANQPIRALHSLGLQQMFLLPIKLIMQGEKRETSTKKKDLLYGFRGNFPCGIQRVVPSGQDGSILPARIANHSARFGSSCPLAELAIY